MKSIKKILLATLTTCAISLSQAQEVKQEIKSAPSTVPTYQTNPELTGNGKQQQQPQLKESTSKPVLVDDKDEKMKPQLAPSQNIVSTPVITADKRESAINRAPVVPVQSSNVAPIPASRPAKSTPPSQLQQQN